MEARAPSHSVFRQPVYKMRGFLTALLLCCALANGLEEPRKKKQFSLFSMVQFENLPCQGVGSNDEATTGVCYTATECDEKQGNEIGKCASGFGVCCMVKTSTCGSTVSQNCSYIQNPTFPSTYAPTTAGACAFNVKPVGPNICQIKLDFLKLSLSGKEATGACGGANTNTLTINGPTTTDPPTLCGDFDGQHIYVENGAQTANTVLTFDVKGAGSSWNIKVNQIACDSEMRPPTGCLQYYTGIGGTFKSLGHGDNARMLQENYVICFRREEGRCQIEYSIATADSFKLGTATAKDGQAITDVANVGNTEAYLIIDGAPSLFYGGAKLADTTTSTVSAAVRSSTYPFRVRNSGTIAQKDTANAGFDLSWHQVPC